LTPFAGSVNLIFVGIHPLDIVSEQTETQNAKGHQVDKGKKAKENYTKHVFSDEQFHPTGLSFYFRPFFLFVVPNITFARKHCQGSVSDNNNKERLSTIPPANILNH